MKARGWFERLIDPVFNLVYKPWYPRMEMVWRSTAGVTQAASIVATLAPPEAVDQYLKTVTQGDISIFRWFTVYSSGGALVPLAFLIAGRWLVDFGNPWLVVGAQVVWIALWTVGGLPWLQLARDVQIMELRARAMTAMCETCDPTLDQLNAASERLGLGEWTKGRPDHD